MAHPDRPVGGKGGGDFVFDRSADRVRRIGDRRMREKTNGERCELSPLPDGTSE